MAFWIFKCDPKRYRLSDRLMDPNPEITWMVTRYKKEIAPGDTVFLAGRASCRVTAAGQQDKATLRSIVPNCGVSRLCRARAPRSNSARGASNTITGARQRLTSARLRGGRRGSGARVRRVPARGPSPRWQPHAEPTRPRTFAK